MRYDLRSAPGSAVAKPALYRAALEQCAWADRLGFAMVTLSEHHGSPDGYLPSPMVMAAAIAARTERLRIMISTLVATLYDPARLAEDFAVLDNLSNGRILPVLSAGYVASEFESFGKRLGERKKAMDGIAGFLRQAWTGEPFALRGTHGVRDAAPGAGSPADLDGRQFACRRRARGARCRQLRALQPRVLRYVPRGTREPRQARSRAPVRPAWGASCTWPRIPTRRGRRSPRT